MNRPAWLDLVALVAAILLIGWGALRLADWGIQATESRLHKAEHAMRSASGPQTGIIVSGQMTRAALRAGPAAPAALPLYEATARELGWPGMERPDSTQEFPAWFSGWLNGTWAPWEVAAAQGQPALPPVLEPWSMEDDMPAVPAVPEVTEQDQAIAALVSMGGATAGAALVWHVEAVQRALSWRRLVDDWQADWSDWLLRFENGALEMVVTR